MIIINSRLPTQNLKIAKSLSKLIQGYIYSYLPKAEHDGYKHETSGKNFNLKIDTNSKDNKLKDGADERT